MAQIRRKRYRDKKTGKIKTRPKWYIRYRAGDGRWREVPGYTDKRATESKAHKLEVQSQREREGLAVPQEANQRQPLTKHIADFRSYLESKGGVEGHAGHVVQRVEKLVVGCEFKQLTDIKLSAVQKFVSALTFKQNGKKAIERPASLQTKNYYIGAFKHFIGWLMKEGRLTANPVASLARYNTATCEKRGDRLRRALTTEEVRRVIQSTSASPSLYRGLSGQERAMLYALAVGTGLRASEIASVTPRDFNFTTSPATVWVSASETKDRKEIQQPIAQGVAELIRSYIESKPAGEPVWPGTWRERISKITRKDLVAAGVTPRTADGTFDFHGWRHTYITFLVMSGMNPKQAQSLARHSDIRLTMDRYAHLSQQQRLDAVSMLPPLLDAKCPLQRPLSMYPKRNIETQADALSNKAGEGAENEKAPVNMGEKVISPVKQGHSSEWTEPGMIRRPKDFQSFALPAELSVLGLTSIYEDSPVV